MKYLIKLCIFFSSMMASTLLAAGFTIGFNDGATSRTDFKVSENAVLTSEFTLEQSANDKVVTYTIPEQLTVEAPAGATETTDASGNTVVTITYDKDDIAYRSTAVTLSLDAAKMYSKANYQITVTFEDGNGNTTSKTADITVFDYAGQPDNVVKLYQMTTSIDPLVSDTEILFKFEVLNQGAYDKSGALVGGGYTTSLKNPQLDLKQIKVDTTGNGNNYVNLDPSDFIVSTDGILDYDPSTGIVTFNDTDPFKDTVILPVKMTVKSSAFGVGSLIRFNTDDILSYSACENDSDCLGAHPDAKIDVADSGKAYQYEVLDTTEDYLNLSIIKTANEGDYVRTDFDNQPLFQIYGHNYTNKLENISFKVRIPDGMLIQQVFAGSGAYGSVTVDDGVNLPQTFSQGGSDYFQDAVDLNHSIDGDSINEFTVTLTRYEAYAYNDSSYHPERLIYFLGKMDGNIYSKDDTFNVSIDSTSIEADVVDSTSGLTDYAQSIIDPKLDDNTLDRKINQLQIPSPNLSSAFEDGNGSIINSVQVDLDQQTVIQIRTEIDINDYSYGSDYHQIDNPVIYFDVPKELMAEDGSFDANDVELVDSSGATITIDSVGVVSGNNVFADGQIVEVKTSNYNLVYPNTLTARLKTVVAPAVIETATIDQTTDYPIAIGSLNKDTTGSIRGDVSNLSTSSDIAGNLIGDTLGSLSIVIPKEVNAQLLVNTTDDGDADNNYHAVYSTTDKTRYPEYYLEANAAYRVTFTNSTASSSSSFYGIVTLPNIAVDQIIEPSEDYNNDPSGPVVTASYSEDGSTFGPLPADGKVVAIKYTFASFGAGQSYQAKIPFTTEGLTVEDDTIYGGNAAGIGETLFNFDGTSHTGTTTGIQIVKSAPPEITLNSIANNDVYDYTNITDLVNDIADYRVEDDRNASITDIIKDDSTLVSFNKDSESLGTLSSGASSFADLQAKASAYNEDVYDAGEFAITYQTDKDTDAQQAKELVNIKVYPRPYLSDPTTSTISIEYGAAFTIDDLITQSGVVNKGNDSDYYTLAKTSPDSIDNKDLSLSSNPVIINLDDTGNNRTGIDSKTVNYIVTLPTLTLTKDAIDLTKGDSLTQTALETEIGAVITGDGSGGDVIAELTDYSNIDFTSTGCYTVNVAMKDKVTSVTLGTKPVTVCIKASAAGTSAIAIPSASLYSLLMLIASVLGLTLYYRRRS